MFWSLFNTREKEIADKPHTSIKRKQKKKKKKKPASA